jgi:hypothetical protein
MSNRAIAEVVNASRNTPANDVAQSEPPEKVTGQDGKNATAGSDRDAAVGGPTESE